MSEKELTGIELIKSMKPETVFRLLNRLWIIGGPEADGSFRVNIPWSNGYLLLSDTVAEPFFCCNSEITAEEIREAFATASKDTVTILWPKEEHDMSEYTEYGITPAQYHAGLDKLWSALGLTDVQEKDVFTLAAEAIKSQPEEKVCEWVLDKEGNCFNSQCGHWHGTGKDGTLLAERIVCQFCGGEIKVKEPEPAPEGMVEIERTPETVLREGMRVIYTDGTRWTVDKQWDSTNASQYTVIAKIFDKLENVLPPPPEGTVWFPPGTDDVWMEGDYCWESLPERWGQIGDTKWGVGHTILPEYQNHSHICRKPCTWTRTAKGVCEWECDCMEGNYYVRMLDSCPNCNRPIIEVKPEPELRYVEMSEGGFRLHKDCDWTEAAFTPFGAPEIEESLGLKFLGWATEEGGTIYDTPNPILSKLGTHIGHANKESFQAGEAKILDTPYAVFQQLPERKDGE
jgi:hypothetical protein